MSSLPEEGTDKEGEQNDHYQEPSIVESLIYESIEDPHCLVNDYFDSNVDHILEANQSHGNIDMIVSEPDKNILVLVVSIKFLIQSLITICLFNVRILTLFQILQSFLELN